MRILWIPHTGWHIPQRAHLFTRALSARHEVHVTDWIADFASARDYLSYKYLRNFTRRYHRDGQIHVHGIPRISPALFSARLRRLNQRIFSHYIQRIIDQTRIDVVVGTFVVPPPIAPRVIFDLFDDNVAYWREFGHVKEYADEIAANEQLYLNKADATVAASSVLRQNAERLAPGRPIHLIPNGIDLAIYRRANGSEFRAEIGSMDKLVGIVGSHDKRNEMERIIGIASLMVDEPFIFLIVGRGTQLAWAKQEVQKQGLHNVRFHGFIPLEHLPNVMSALDVGLCPYKKSAGADASSPMRLLSYLAAGVPVVCTELTSVRQCGFENVVLVDDTPEAFAYAIRHALSLPRQSPSRLDEFDLSSLVAKYERVLEGSEVGSSIARERTS